MSLAWHGAKGTKIKFCRRHYFSVYNHRSAVISTIMIWHKLIKISFVESKIWTFLTLSCDKTFTLTTILWQSVGFGQLGSEIYMQVHSALNFIPTGHLPPRLQAHEESTARQSTSSGHGAWLEMETCALLDVDFIDYLLRQGTGQHGKPGRPCMHHVHARSCWLVQFNWVQLHIR